VGDLSGRGGRRQGWTEIESRPLSIDTLENDDPETKRSIPHHLGRFFGVIN
jgi:hypothetical protein